MSSRHLSRAFIDEMMAVPALFVVLGIIYLMRALLVHRIYDSQLLV